MPSRTYYTQWRSREECEALELTETMRLPVEKSDPAFESNGGLAFGDFQPGDYEVRQNGRVFGRSKAEHEARFKPAVNKPKAKEAVKRKSRKRGEATPTDREVPQLMEA